MVGRPKGTPKTGGRVAGKPNKATAEIKQIAREYGPAAVRKLAEMAGLVKGVSAAESEAARVTANREILDRGYGKAVQGVEISNGDDKPFIVDATLTPAQFAGWQALRAMIDQQRKG